MKELKEFTVERLEEIIEWTEVFGRHPKLNECTSLAKIAMAAKQAKPVGRIEGWDSHQDIYIIQWFGNQQDLPKGSELYTTPPLNHTDQHLDMVKLLRNLVDVVWSEAKESEEVPSTKWADEMIAKVYPVAAPKPEM